ncbi:MAG: hypothetical protein IKG56_01440 [Clostridia bacterium]|nr:hypothetical protein [Clostridia bacterium]
MFEKIKDSIAERMLNKIIDEKEINITVSVKDNSKRPLDGTQQLQPAVKESFTDILRNSTLDLKVSFKNKGEQK